MIVDASAREINLAISKNEREMKFEAIEKNYPSHIKAIMNEVTYQQMISQEEHQYIRDDDYDVIVIIILITIIVFMTALF